MSETSPESQGFFQELRRRRVFATAGLYVVGAWLVMQAADVFFPGWEIPDRGINVLLIATIVGFPLALVFGWFFNITTHGIRRTAPLGPEGAGEPRPLKSNDYFVLATLVLVAGAIISYATVQVLAMRGIAPTPVVVEKVPNSVAVLPFVNDSNDPDNEYFCDGVSNEILNKLAAHLELHVIGRTSSFVFKGSDYGIPRISALLGVHYLLQGSVQKVGDKLRVSAQLVDDSGAQRWSSTFDRTLTDIFAIQTEIADLVATTVVPQIAPESSTTYKPDVTAYEHFLAGRELVYRRDTQRALEELRMAIDLDPGYADPYPELAIALLYGSVDESKLAKAREAIDTALTLHPRMPRALAAEGLLFEQQSPPDNMAAEAVLRRALEQSPGMVDTMNWLANALLRQGKLNEANALRYRAYSLDPLHAPNALNLAGSDFSGGDLVTTEEIQLKLVQVPHPAQPAFAFLSWTYASLAMWDRTEYCLQRSLQGWPDMPFNPWLAGLENAWKGHYLAALEDFDRYVAAHRVDVEDVLAVDSYFYGYFLAMAGDYEEAVEVMQSQYEHAPVQFGELEVDALHVLALALFGVGEERRAKALLESIELAAADQREVDPERNPLAYWLARNAALLGDKELALERLRLAIDTGWRGYYTDSHDPRLSSIADDPRFQAMMAEVKADVDRQRAEVEAIHPSLDLPPLSH
jgi:TolB-like protein